ncbi:MAG: MiaB/RimO family radical SAM methylthiotransferase [Anaerolineae bacterium]|nr:MiaB/RimO family radical SAM methylthiotransferase [Anaerolineae bacterium]
MTLKVYLESLGCRLNAAEIEQLGCQLLGGGFVPAQCLEEADVLVLNTCAVTAEASRKSRRRLNLLHRRNPQAAIAVLGCWVTAEPEAAGAQPGVNWVIPNAEKARAAEHILGAPAAPVPWVPGLWHHTRAFLPVQDGCDSACTYCYTRVLRGPAHSTPLPAVLAQAQSMIVQGAQEIVLTGVSLGAYGHDLPDHVRLADLVAALLEQTAVPRLRLSSVEPWDVDERLLQLWDNPRLCQQLHLPLQSGCETTLRRMGRRNTAAEFAARVAYVRTICPDIAVTTDIITGFPGETEADFAASLNFVEELGFARLHVFPYSERHGTAALRLSGTVPPQLRVARAAQMRALGDSLATAYRARFAGEVLPVLWERQDRAGRWRGLTGNYLEVVLESAADLHNTITSVRLLPGAGEIFTCAPIGG